MVVVVRGEGLGDEGGQEAGRSCSLFRDEAVTVGRSSRNRLVSRLLMSHACMRVNGEHRTINRVRYDTDTRKIIWMRLRWSIRRDTSLSIKRNNSVEARSWREKRLRYATSKVKV